MKSRPLNNNWHEATTNVSTFRLLCCDCGLVHKVKIKRKGKSLLFKISRNQRSTGQYRRWRNYPLNNKPTEAGLNADQGNPNPLETKPNISIQMNESIIHYKGVLP